MPCRLMKLDGEGKNMEAQPTETKKTDRRDGSVQAKVRKASSRTKKVGCPMAVTHLAH